MSKPQTIEQERLNPGPAAWQEKWYEVIFEAETPAGKLFDVVLLVVIVVSILTVMLESVAGYRREYGAVFFWLEWVITGLFTIEFIARLACVNQHSKYLFSFYGLVDLVALLPSYLGLFFSGTHALAVIRTLRLLRVFRVLKLTRHVSEARTLLIALRQTWPKITVFLLVMVCAILISGTVMYLIERDQGSGFDNIPISVYWAIVTMTTVGYGDIAPATDAGRFVAAILMLFGYAVIIVPTGIFSAQVVTAAQESKEKNCPACGAPWAAPQASYCWDCGAALTPRD
ncbi:MAG: ion transporter [Planctomycetales bacterium]|nr:ion transporter [Planctomycetales bacterium]